MNIVFLGVTFAWLCDYEAGRIPLRRLIWLVPIYVIWTNVHGGMVGGVATMAVTFIGWLVAARVGWAESSRPTTPNQAEMLVKEPFGGPRRLGPPYSGRMLLGLGLLIVVCGLTAFVNPYDIALPRVWFALMGSKVLPELIIEHAPLRYAPREAVAVLAFAAVYLAALVGTWPKRPQVSWLIPLVWLALRRLRADRELVCDAMVMSRLAADERRAYGNTLIRLLDGFSDSGFCPSLAPIINHKQEIKRRVIMIAKFRPAGRAALALSAMLIATLCCFTFTRAAEKKPALREAAPLTQQAASKADTAQHSETGSSSIQSLGGMRQKFAELTTRVHEAETRVDELKRKFSISDTSYEGALAISALVPQTVRSLEEQRIRVAAEYSGSSGMLNALLRLREEKGEAELRKSILTAVNDELLSRLMMDSSATGTALARMRQTVGPENADFKATAAMQADLDEKINQRINGVLAGLKVRVDVFQATLESLTKSVDDARKQDAESSGRFRAYFEAKRDLENLQRVRDALSLKILEREYGVEVPKVRSEEK